MVKQSQVFLDSEGEKWLARNKARLPVKNDPVLDTLSRFPQIQPKEVLEVGCADGWRLLELQKKYSCGITGVDPGIDPSNRRNHSFLLGEASDLPFADCFDLVIYGFCLYLCDREDLFKIVAEGDRVLQEGGYLLVYDFASPPCRQAYSHKPGLFSYKQDYAALWQGNPAYSLYTRQYYGTGSDTTSVTILKKNMDAWPLKK